MLSALFLALIAFPTASPAADARAAVQDPAPLPDKRPEVEKALAEFKAHIDKKGVEDTDAIELIDQKLMPEFKNSGPKDRASIVKEIARAFDQKRAEEREGVPNVKLYIAAAAALGEMGPESTKALAAAIDNKNFKKLPAVRHRIVISLGKTKDVKDGLEPLIDLLNDKDAPMINAAGEALGEFKDADQATRKKAFEAMLKILTAANDAVTANPNDTIARERYDTFAPAVITSLGKLCKENLRSPDDFRNWWNKNKGKNWDEK
jgi:hypothetical protein